LPLYRIREMLIEDIPVLLEIERHSFPTPWTEELFKSQLRLKGIGLNRVILEEEEVVGYAAAWVASDELHLLSIAVEPAKRRMGIGSRLLEAVMQEGRERGAKKIILEVRQRNRRAQSFYYYHGFKIIGRRARYYSDTGEDALIMERSLEQRGFGPS